MIDVRSIVGFILDPVDNISTQASNALGFPFDQARLFILLILHIPIGYSMRLVRGSFGRNLYSLIFGLLTNLSLHRNDFLSIFIAAIVLYFFMMQFKKKAAVILYIAGFSMLSAFHIHRLFVGKEKIINSDYGGYSMDLALLLMLMTIKVTYSAWEVHDLKERQEQNKKNGKALLRRMPTLLDFLSYNFSFIGIVGPVYNLSDYIDFVDEKRNYKLIRNLLVPFLKSIGIFVIIIICFLKFSAWCYTLPEILSDEFRQNHGILTRFGWINFFAVVGRFRYYTAWTLNQISIDACGISFNKETNDYSRWINVHPFTIEFKQDPKSRVSNWNLGTQRWLKSTFYDKWHSKVVTFLLSAFWHGFYPSYYVGFTYFHFVGEVQKLVYKNQKLILGEKGSLRATILNIVFTIFYGVYTNCALLAFASLTFDQTVRAQKLSYFSVAVPIVLFFGLKQYIAKNKKKGKKVKGQ